MDLATQRQAIVCKGNRDQSLFHQFIYQVGVNVHPM